MILALSALGCLPIVLLPFLIAIFRDLIGLRHLTGLIEIYIILVPSALQASGAGRTSSCLGHENMIS